MLEQRIRRRRGQNRVTRIGEQLEQKRVGLARRGRDRDVLGLALKLLGQRLTRAGEAQRVRLVGGSYRAGHDPGELFDRVVESGASGIRFSQVQHAGSTSLTREREAVDWRVPFGSA